MSAMNGPVAFRVRMGLVACCVAVALLASALLSSSASAAKSLKPTAYVAIGDSLAFGYKEKTFNENFPAEPASAFEGGYVGVFAKKLAAAEKKAGNALETLNLGCPGETSNGVLGNHIGGEEEEYNPCAYHFVAGFPLKTEYETLKCSPPACAGEETATSQLEAAAIAVVTKDVRAVTINIGSNDELATVAKCENPAYLAEQGFSSFTQCLVTEAGPSGHQYPGGLFSHIIQNVGQMIAVLRFFEYNGPVVVLGFYNPQSFALPGSDSLQKQLNEAFEATIASESFGPGVKYANPFPIINPQGKPKSEKKKIEKFTEYYNPAVIKENEEKGKGSEGDIHPTAKGYKKMGKLVWEKY